MLNYRFIGLSPISRKSQLASALHTKLYARDAK